MVNIDSVIHKLESLDPHNEEHFIVISAIADLEQLKRDVDALKHVLVRMDGWLKERHLVGLMPDELALLD